MNDVVAVVVADDDEMKRWLEVIQSSDSGPSSGKTRYPKTNNHKPSSSTVATLSRDT
jgi:hypothetical protein